MRSFWVKNKVKMREEDSPINREWIVLKLFLPKGGDKGEVFLNLNPVLGRGEFSIKDEDYGDYLLRQFAKVF